ncbi:MAG TPA: sulfite exporter TauE/SafE family protein, partial [Kofleriaceae bacterium]|nr:sulfite exporter TauE/SafE family protein [Kofleriaceae bacterium]
IGLIAGLLPCGWLWAFVITAAGTGGAASGALVMLAFWLGTVPMVLLLSLAGPVFARLRARLPVITAVTLLALGLGTLAFRWQGLGAPPSVHGCHHCAGPM